MNWFESYNYCRSIGGDLLNIESQEELQALQKYLLEINIESQLWTDGNDLAREGRYMSHTTGRPLVFVKWLSNNPDNQLNEDCIEGRMQGNDKTLQMNDNKCEHEYYAFCQYRATTMHCSAPTSLMNSNENCMLKNIAEAFTQAADMHNACTQHTLQPTA
ncbi:C-type lectin 37Db-like [Zeugodacus cucurbitae]|uniref:C-type lectin 37Db-like n=1 Tax=Zeugodacus cucurbitae TaxID=28588 RepID=UPI0023D8F340|nr:C-type lectin 37Db-like [Zeugodacus cucurbitae]